MPTPAVCARFHRPIRLPSRSARRDLERGSAVIDFALVSALVIVLVMGVVQLALLLHVRSVLIDAAGEGARHAALLGGELGQGERRTRDLISSALTPAYATDITATRRGTDDAYEVVEVTVRAPAPVLGLLGPSGAVTVTGRAVQER